MSNGKLLAPAADSTYPLPTVLNDEKSTMCTLSLEHVSRPRTVVCPDATVVPDELRSVHAIGVVDVLTTVACLGIPGAYATWLTLTAGPGSGAADAACVTATAPAPASANVNATAAGTCQPR